MGTTLSSLVTLQRKAPYWGEPFYSIIRAPLISVIQRWVPLSLHQLTRTHWCYTSPQHACCRTQAIALSSSVPKQERGKQSIQTNYTQLSSYFLFFPPWVVTSSKQLQGTWLPDLMTARALCHYCKANILLFITHNSSTNYPAMFSTY